MQIASIRELRPVSVVRLHMVHISGPGADTTLCTFPTKRFPQKLPGAQIIQPLRREIHPVPGLGLLAAPGAVFGLVGCAVSTRHQDAAARMPARPERFLCHRAITSGQNRRAWADTSAICGSCGSGSLAQAQIDIQKSLPLAMAAIGICLDLAIRWEPEKFHHSAYRADDPSIR